MDDLEIRLRELSPGDVICVTQNTWGIEENFEAEVSGLKLDYLIVEIKVPKNLKYSDGRPFYTSTGGYWNIWPQDTWHKVDQFSQITEPDESIYNDLI